MRLLWTLSATFLLASSLAPRFVRADQARDWMVAAQPAGTYANIDVIFPGAQLQLEHRIRFYGQANELNLKANVLPTVVFTEAQVDADLRLVVLSLGASAGYRTVFHNLAFAHGQNYDSA